MYKLLDYDITEYKQLENTLNELSKQGYNPTSLGKISRFEKNEKHYYFHVDLPNTFSTVLFDSRWLLARLLHQRTRCQNQQPAHALGGSP